MKDKESFAVGGQAVIEGVMMRGKNIYSLAVRNANTNQITVEIKSLENKDNKFFKLPIVRGIVNFWQSLLLGTKILIKSAELSGIEDTSKPSKIEVLLQNKLGIKFTDYIIYFSIAVSIFMSIILFMVFPVLISSILNKYFNFSSLLLSTTEGIIRIIIFLTYIFITSRLKDVSRVFMYHGAEHKTINCYENNEELTLENVKKQSRLHKRCGTSFLIIVMLVSIIFFMLFETINPIYRIITRIIFIPIIAGISYEIIKLAGKKDNFLINLISKPGLSLQKITTKEPDDSMIEVAIESLKGVLKNE